MARPITMQNINLPNQNSAFNFFRLGSGQLNKGLTDLSQLAQNEANRIDKAQYDSAVNQIQGLNTLEDVAAAQADENFFNNLGLSASQQIRAREELNNQKDFIQSSINKDREFAQTQQLDPLQFTNQVAGQQDIVNSRNDRAPLAELQAAAARGEIDTVEQGINNLSLLGQNKFGNKLRNTATTVNQANTDKEFLSNFKDFLAKQNKIPLTNRLKSQDYLDNNPSLTQFFNIDDLTGKLVPTQSGTKLSPQRLAEIGYEEPVSPQDQLSRFLANSNGSVSTDVINTGINLFDTLNQINPQTIEAKNRRLFGARYNFLNAEHAKESFEKANPEIKFNKLTDKGHGIGDIVKEYVNLAEFEDEWFSFGKGDVTSFGESLNSAIEFAEKDLAKQGFKGDIPANAVRRALSRDAEVMEAYLGGNFGDMSDNIQPENVGAAISAITQQLHLEKQDRDAAYAPLLENYFVSKIDYESLLGKN